MKKRHQSAVHVLPHLASTPLGDELVLGPECEEPTRIMHIDHLKHLLGDANPHTHETVMMMKAVKAG
jgi:hypothetical protein